MADTSGSDSSAVAGTGRRVIPGASLWVWALAALWLTGVIVGLRVVWTYENTAGAAAHPPSQWPASSPLSSATDRPTLVFVAHPQCTCTRASLDELQEVLAHAEIPPKAYVLFLKPTVFEDHWEETDLWRRAAAVPGVTVVRDADGHEARRFGVETSGQTLLFDAGGRLIFSGGITGSRGHAGTNAGEQALIGYLTRGKLERNATSVFGCPLFSPAPDRQEL